MPRQQYKIRLAGCSFDNRQDMLRFIRNRKVADIKLQLQREPENQYDSNAIAVIMTNPLSAKIGYIPKQSSHYFADKIDKDIPVHIARIEIIGGHQHKETLGCLITLEFSENFT